MRLKIAVSVVRFRPWAPIKSIAWLNYQISRSRRGQRSGQQSAVFIGRPHGREITGQIRARRCPNRLTWRMPWTDSFWKPIKLNDGRVPNTLGDARDFI